MIQAYHTIRFWLIIVLLSIVLGTVSVSLRLVDPSGSQSRRISALWGRLLCRWNGVRVEVEGLEHVRSDRAQVFIANHQGFFDIFSLSGYLPAPLFWVAKSSLFKIPFVGWSMRAAGYIPVERHDRKKAHQAFLTSIEKLKKGYSIVIFPEGTRSEDGTIGPFKKGGQLMALRAQTPMVPVTIIGSGPILAKGSMWIRPRPIRIIIGEPVEYERISSKREETVLDDIRETIRANYRRHVPAHPQSKMERAEIPPGD
jgi:1-acyl-sn-glycerol-3-phosphate acyltransferase